MSHHLLRAAGRLGFLYGLVYVPSYFFLRWYRSDAIGLDIGFTAGWVALPFAVAIGYVAGARQYLSEERLLLRSIEQPVFKDGQRAVVMGPIVPLADPLRSPLGGRECVAYEYQIDHEGRDQDHRPIRVRDYWGMAVCPTAIETSGGRVRVLGYARIEHPFDILEGEDVYRSAQDYVRATPFRHPTHIGERRGSLAEPMDAESDQFRDDICANPQHVGHTSLRGEDTDLGGLRLNERYVEVGQTVCAAGSYSARLQALVPTASGPKQLRITTFSPQQWASENRDWAYTYFRWGAFFAVVGVAGALATRWC
jgi:hypothetical protein